LPAWPAGETSGDGNGKQDSAFSVSLELISLTAKMCVAAALSLAMVMLSMVVGVF
jgi:hypothetical protein